MRAGMLRTLCMTSALAGCAFSHEAIRPPSENAARRDQLIVDGDAPLDRQQQALIDELTALRQEVAAGLQLPASGAPVYLHLFDTRERLERSVGRAHPDLLDRRAFFVAEGDRLQVYACQGVRLAEDLRHEVTHGYLHAMVPQLPLWLDEGLAEYFEVPSAAHGLNRPHITLLLERWQDRRWAPDLPRLERLRASHEMTQQDYAESWAWVQFLLDSSPSRRACLDQYLTRLRQAGRQPDAPAPPLSSLLATAEPHAAQALIEHLRQL